MCLTKIDLCECRSSIKLEIEISKMLQEIENTDDETYAIDLK